MKKLRIIPLMLLILIMVVPSVYASWIYCELPIVSADDNVSLKMGIYKWEGSDILPDDEEEGLAHANLIDKIINGEGIGLNTSDSYLNEQISNRQNIWRRDTLGSMAVTQGNALNELFDLGTENITFLIQMASSDTYYLFTTSLDLGSNGSPNYAIGTEISPIYRTTIKKSDGVWTATVTEEGSATSAYYEESRIFNPNKTKIPSFNPDSWKVIAS